MGLFFGFRFYRRKKSQSKPLQWNPEHDPSGETPHIDKGAMVVWQNPLKDDDDTMLRMFKGVDGRITDHVLNFYIPDEGAPGPGELSKMKPSNRRSVELQLSKLEHLVTLDVSRVYALRAVLGGIIWGAVHERAFFTPKREGKLTCTPGMDPANEEAYHESRELAILRLAQVAHEQLRGFTKPGVSDGNRRQGLESVIRAAAEFAEVIEKQPVQFELVWKAKVGKAKAGKKQSTNGFVEDVMEVAVRVHREGHEPKVRGVVCPGLRKSTDQESVLLSKIQVVLF